MTSQALYPTYNQYTTSHQQEQLPHPHDPWYHQRSGAYLRQPPQPYIPHQPLHLEFPYHRPPNMAGSDINDMERFQQLSDHFHADLPGPLIGEKLPMTTLVEEYTAADHSFVVKTQTLAATHSGYRRVKGDGQCGWRGAVFGYFETLLGLGHMDLIIQEEIRLRSFRDTMSMAGVDYEIIEDMFEFTWELFAELKEAVEKKLRGDVFLLAAFNDENRSNSIVYHFKMMTSSFMELNPGSYEPFLEMPIADYRVARIDPSNQEIDQIGLQVLTDAIIAQAGFALDVLYLDRSIGDEVTPHEFAPKNKGGPTIRLLYRPGHYDVIYKDNRDIQVFLQKDSLVPQSMEMSYPSTMPSDFEAYLFPGPQVEQTIHAGSLGFAPSSSQLQHAYSYQDQPYYLAHAPYQHVAGHATLTHNYQSAYSNNFSSPGSSSISSSPNPPTPSMSVCMAPPQFTTKLSSEPQIRLNEKCYNYGLKHESVPLCSQTFGNAASLSTAHFRNQEFQPQIWNADEEYAKP